MEVSLCCTEPPEKQNQKDPQTTTPTICPSISACSLCAVLIPATVLRAWKAQGRQLEHLFSRMGIFSVLPGWPCSPPSLPSTLRAWQGSGIASNVQADVEQHAVMDEVQNPRERQPLTAPAPLIASALWPNRRHTLQLYLLQNIFKKLTTT